MSEKEKLSYKLEVFEGPLDLLLDLISKNKIDITDIPVAVLLEQYMEQINAMREADIDIASEFLTMASRLLYIKTASLLPKQSEEAEALRKELAEELMGYQLCREMAKKLTDMADFDQFSREEMKIEADRSYKLHHDISVIYDAYIAAATRTLEETDDRRNAFGEIVAKPVFSVEICVTNVLGMLYKSKKASLNTIFMASRSRSEAVATFLAVLDLLKAERISLEDDGSIVLV